jgi:pyrimidine-nucleoside phosphorylase
MKKRNGGEHTQDEIRYLVCNYTEGNIPDYQVSAWLMAAFLKGLSENETFFLTREMLDSGTIMDLSSIEKPKVDKHSTGGVGDNISLILAPAVAACGVAVPMTSGRGLGFTGGTLDKLESIPGYNVSLRHEQILSLLKEVGFAMTGPTEDIAPADKKLYELRDVTATVESIPLITSSILSKKLAEGADSMVMDVKFGSGAFMKTKKDAKKLAYSLVSVSKKMGKRAVCVLSSMDQPLGRTIGNSLEVAESIECLQGEGSSDLVALTKVLGGYMLMLAGMVHKPEDGEAVIQEKLRNGEAFNKFRDNVRAQGGDVEAILNKDRLPAARHSYDVLSRKQGYVAGINTEDIGNAAVFLGAGRFTKEDTIDASAGMIIHKKLGNFVRRNSKLVTLYYNSKKNLDETVDLVLGAYKISNDVDHTFQLIHEPVL